MRNYSFKMIRYYSMKLMIWDSSTHPSIHPPILPSTYPSIHSSIYPFSVLPLLLFHLSSPQISRDWCAFLQHLDLVLNAGTIADAYNTVLTLQELTLMRQAHKNEMTPKIVNAFIEAQTRYQCLGLMGSIKKKSRATEKQFLGCLVQLGLRS